MKLKDTFITYNAAGEHTTVATEGFSGVIRSNETAAFIIEALKEPTTLEQIVDAMAVKYNAPREVLEKDVAEALTRLRSIGAIEEVLARDGKLVYTCVGTSMMPLLRQRRDLMILERPRGALQKYDVPLFKRDSGKYVLHRVLQVRRDGYVLCGDNQWRREYGVTDRQIIGVLTAFVRDGKEIPVTDPRYRLYVHLWCDLFWLRAAVLWCLALPGRIKRKLTRHP